MDDGVGIGTRPLYLAYPWLRIAAGVVVVLAIGLVATGVGSVYIPPLTTAKILVDNLPLVDMDATWPDSWDTIIWQIRFPRIVLAALVGGCLAISGATYQGLFRNPLADPYLIGVSAGAGWTGASRGSAVGMAATSGTRVFRQVRSFAIGR